MTQTNPERLKRPPIPSKPTKKDPDATTAATARRTPQPGTTLTHNANARKPRGPKGRRWTKPPTECQASVETKEEKTEETNTQDVVDKAIDNGGKTKRTSADTTAPTET